MEGNPDRVSNRKSPESVQNVVTSGYSNFNRTQTFASATNLETRTKRERLNFFRTPVIRGFKSKRGDGLREARQTAAHAWVIPVHSRATIEWQLRDKFDKRRLNGLQRSVVIQVIVIDVGDDRKSRWKVKEASITFVGFCHDPFTLSELRVSAQGVHLAANDHRGIQARMSQNGCHHRSTGGLAVTSCHSDSGFSAHQLAQHLGPGNDRDAVAARFQNLGIIGPNG